MTATAHYRMFGNYNAWANNRRVAATAQFPTDQYRTDRGAFFGSVYGRLNLLLVTDRIWMRRFNRRRRRAGPAGCDPVGQIGLKSRKLHCRVRNLVTRGCFAPPGRGRKNRA
jgi:DinB family